MAERTNIPQQPQPRLAMGLPVSAELRKVRDFPHASRMFRVRAGPIEELVTFDLRNGPLEDARSLLVKPTLGESWYWRFVTNMPPEDYIHWVGCIINMYAFQLTRNRPAGFTNVQVRKSAIILGTARAVSTQLYSLTANDVVVGEMANPWLEMMEDNDGAKLLVATDAAPADLMAHIEREMVFTNDEMAALKVLHMCSVGLLPMQGYSLIMTGHHYLSDPASQSRKAYDVVERALWVSQEVSTWFSSDKGIIQDVLWHKSTHPVSMLLRKQLSTDPRVAKMIVAAGAGISASRLPAVEAEMRAANSTRTLLQTVRPMFEMSGGGMNSNLLTLAIDVVGMFSAHTPSAALPANMVMPAGVPERVVNRMTALKWLSEIIDNNRDTIAYAYGFYTAMSEHSAMMGTSTTTDTLKMSYSLLKLKTQCFASYVAGQQAHGDYAAVRGKQRMEGRLTVPSFGLD